MRPKAQISAPASGTPELHKAEVTVPRYGVSSSPRPLATVAGRFFHHEKKSEEEAKQDDPTPEPTHEEHKHHFLRGLLHGGD